VWLSDYLTQHERTERSMTIKIQNTINSRRYIISVRRKNMIISCLCGIQVCLYGEYDTETLNATRRSIIYSCTSELVSFFQILYESIKSEKTC